jgi:hypothetical protein
MRIRNVAIWTAERAAEIASGGVLMTLLWGRSGLRSPLLGELGLTMSLAGLFCLVSGYIITCAVMGLRAVRRPPVRHGAAMGWAFLLHCMLFFTMFGPAPVDGPVFKLVGSGMAAVFFINTAGALAWRRPPMWPMAEGGSPRSAGQGN